MESKINCSVTVLPVHNGKVGFIRRKHTDTFGGLLVAPGGKIEPTDGELLDGVPYWSVENCAIREMMEETGVTLRKPQLSYFCSLTLPNGRVVISFYSILTNKQANQASKLEFISKEQIEQRIDFAPGMKQEALLLLQTLNHNFNIGVWIDQET